MPHRRVLAPVSLAVFAVTAVLSAYPALLLAGEPDVVVYSPPVDAVVIDDFRAPPTPYASGNRGLEYDTSPGTTARATAPGEVVFAGVVAGTKHVTLLHTDGLRSTVSFLETITVERGERVGAGDVLGTTGSRLHFGVRAHDTYLDPEILFRGEARSRIRLVPTDSVSTASTSDERRAIQAWLASRKPSILAASSDWLSDRVLGAGRLGAYLLPALNPAGYALETGLEIYERLSHRSTCTPVSVEPPRSTERRIVVLVGGLGSTSESAAIDDVDTTALGYDRADVYRFSYEGGRVLDPTDRHQHISASDYDHVSSQIDIRTAGRRLEELVAALIEADPGVPIDVLAHSQGGLVTRWAIDRLDQSGGLDALGSVVTLGTPHGGADLAVALDLLGSDPSFSFAFDLASDGVGSGIDARSTSVSQLAVSSAFTDGLSRRSVPANVSFTSVGARGDLVVPAVRTHLDGAHNVVVPIGGPTAHDRIPGSQEARRELALAIGGLPPTCESTGDVVLDVTTGGAVAHAERIVALAALSGAVLVPG